MCGRRPTLTGDHRDGQGVEVFGPVGNAHRLAQVAVGGRPGLRWCLRNSARKLGASDRSLPDRPERYRPNRFYARLACRLAFHHVPGFRIIEPAEKKEVAKPKWTLDECRGACGHRERQQDGKRAQGGDNQGNEAARVEVEPSTFAPSKPATTRPCATIERSEFLRSHSPEEGFALLIDSVRAGTQGVR